MFRIRGTITIIILLVLVLISCSSVDQEPEQPQPAFDPNRLLTFSEETFPGTEPEPFGSDWFRGGFHSAPVFSPDGKNMWWAGSWGTQKVYVSRYEDGAWTDREEVSFSDDISLYRDPFISPDGMKFYFISTVPIPGVPGSGKENYWMMDWDSGEWSAPEPLPQAVNDLQLHWTPSVNYNYDFYFSANVDGDPDIYVAEFKDGAYQDPIPLGPSVNSPEMEFTPYIAPDGSYLLFARAKDGNTPTLLYISYAQNGGWSDAIRVENVESCINPIVTPDGDYVIYLESAVSLAWRDTSFIEELIPE
jgi:Tol biopolymer transport system component